MYTFLLEDKVISLHTGIMISRPYPYSEHLYKYPLDEMQVPFFLPEMILQMGTLVRFTWGYSDL